jgi:hypothetical protein
MLLRLINLLQENFSNGHELKGHAKEQVKDSSVSNAETEDGNNNEEESFQVNEEQQDNDNNKENEADVRDDPQPSKKKNKSKKYPPKIGKKRDPWIQRPIPYPQEVIKSHDNARFGGLLNY